jgi:hypothetical protein
VKKNEMKVSSPILLTASRISNFVCFPSNEAIPQKKGAEEMRGTNVPPTRFDKRVDLI